PGIGPYAASAVRCFAFGYREPVIDVNTARIFERVFGIAVLRGEPRRNCDVIQAGQELLAGPNPRAVNWALLDVGAALCRPRNPKCGTCPLSSECRYASRASERAL